MVRISTILVLYFDDKLYRAYERKNFLFTTALGQGEKLSVRYRFSLKLKNGQQLKIDRAQLYRAELYTADPNGPDELYTDESYAQDRNLRRLDLNSTGAQIIERSGIAAPLVILKFFF